MIHVAVQYYSCIVLHVSVLLNEIFQWAMGPWHSVLSPFPQFLEVNYIRASVSVVKTHLRMGYAGQMSLVYTLVPVESRTYRQKWQMAQSL